MGDTSQRGDAVSTLFPGVDQSQSESHRRFRIFKQEGMAVAGKLTMKAPIEAGERFCEVPIFRDESTIFSCRVRLQMTEACSRSIETAARYLPIAQDREYNQHPNPVHTLGRRRGDGQVLCRTLSARITSDQLVAAAGRAKTTTAEMSREGTPIRYLRSTFIPKEEKCFCLFKGPSEAAVKQANERAKIPFDRVVEVQHIASEDLR